MIKALDLQEIMVISGGMLGSRASSEASTFLQIGRSPWHIFASDHWMPFSLVAVGVIMACTIGQHYVTEKWQTYLSWAGAGIASAGLMVLLIAQSKTITAYKGL